MKFRIVQFKNGFYSVQSKRNWLDRWYTHFISLSVLNDHLTKGMTDDDRNYCYETRTVHSLEIAQALLNYYRRDYEQKLIIQKKQKTQTHPKVVFKLDA